MNNRMLSQIDTSNPKELRRYEDRLSKRLQRFGYQLSKGTTTLLVRKIPLKRESAKRGYKITNIATGKIEYGERQNRKISKSDKL